MARKKSMKAKTVKMKDPSAVHHDFDYLFSELEEYLKNSAEYKKLLEKKDLA